MYLVIISESFPDEDAQLLREVGHKITTPRSIEKGQKVLDKALKKNLGIPDAVIIDSALKGAQFYAKALKVSINAGAHTTDIYLVVKEDIIAALDPEYFGISGFIEAPLAGNKLLDLVGIPEEMEGEIGEESAEEEAPPPHIEIKRETMTTRPVHRKDAPAGLSQESGAAVKQRHLSNPYKLAFSAVLSVTVITAAIVGFGSFTKKEEPPQIRDIPNFYGMVLKEAEELASSCGLCCEVEYAPAGGIHGTVISQFPPAGTPINETETVSLVVCKEKDKESEGNISESQEDQQSISEAGESGGTLLADAPPGSVSHSPAPSSAYSDTPAPAPPPPKAASGSPPVARISASSTSVSSGSMVTFSASGSYDPDGGPLSYSWSCGGCGVSTSREMVSNVVPGSITVTVTVTDSEAKKSSASITVSIY